MHVVVVAVVVVDDDGRKTESALFDRLRPSDDVVHVLVVAVAVAFVADDEDDGDCGTMRIDRTRDEREPRRGCRAQHRAVIWRFQCMRV